MSTSLAQSLARTLNIQTSLESVDVDINIGQDAIVDEDGAAVSPLAPLTDEPIIEAQETELAEEENEINDTESEADDADADVETLESIQIALESAIDRGGLDTVSYEMFGLTMNHIYRRYGISSANVLPSMESFNEDALGQTEISMEKVKQTLSAVAEGASQLIKKLWFQFKEFLKGMFTFSVSLRKRAEAVHKRAVAAKDNTPPADQIKLYSARHLTIDGKVPQKSALISAYDKATKGTLSLTDVLKIYIDANSDLIREAVDNDGMDVTKFDTLNTKVEQAGKRFMDLQSMFVFGNVEFESTLFGGENNKHAVAGIKIKYDKAPERGADSDNYKVDALSPDEVRNICNNIVKCCNEIDEISKLYTKSNLEKSIIRLSDTKDKKAGGDKGDSKTNRKEIKKAVRALIGTQGKIVRYVTNTNKAMLDYCAQSLQATTKVKAEK